EAHRVISEDLPGTGLLIVTSADRLQRDWIRAQRTSNHVHGSFIGRLLSRLPRTAGLVTMLDGHSAALSWMGAVCGHRIVPLGIETFGQSGTISELYKAYGLDVDAIVGAVAGLLVGAARA